MSTDNFISGKEAKTKLITGFNKVADAVSGTLGAAGYNALLEHQFQPFSETTNDGVSLARSIYLADPFEQMGANLAKEIASRSDKQSHDGTTTATVLAQAILKNGIDAEIAPMQLKKELEECIPLIESSLKDQTKEITVDDVGTVATIAAEDATIGLTIQEIYKQIGKDGILFRDISQTFSDHYTIGKGIKIDDAGFVSPYMAEVSTDGRMQPAATLKEPKVLITKQKIGSYKDLDRIAQNCFQRDVKELVVFCDEIDSTVIPGLVMTRAEKGFRFLVVKMPVLWKDWWYEDLAAITGATIVEPSAGVSFKTVGFQHLGDVGQITVDKNDTYIDGIKDITDHLAVLEAEGTDDAKLRIARLSQKTARYFVGDKTDQALSYRKMKVEDAVGAAWAALHGGIVPGGGIALLNASEYMPQTTGGFILRKALMEPMFQILENAGHEPAGKDEFGGTNGWDAKSGKPVDMFEAGIVDPTEVVKSSMRNAISTAAAILTVGVITLLPKEEKQVQL